MIRVLVIAIVLAFATPALGQQQRQPTPAEMSGIVEALSAQVETTRNLHIQASAKAAGLADDNAKLKAEIEELKKPK